jgi:hypothetical protein
MKYCVSCKKVLPDETEKCPCDIYSWSSRELKILPIEAVCHKCGSTEELSYQEPWKSSSYSYGCECAVCKKKVMDYIAREEAMKYLILDGYQNEDVFCDDKDEVEEHFKYYTNEPWEHENSMSDIIILKLEMVSGKVTAGDFKPPSNTHLVFYDGETYRVEEVIEPKLENQGSDYSLEW